MTKQAYLVSGAGSGIGRAIALAIAQASPDNQVILLGRSEFKLKQVQNALPNSDVHRVLLVDLKSPEMVCKTIHEARLDEAHLVGVVANAGIGGENHFGPDDRWSEIIQTNLSGTYYLVQACLPALRASSAHFRNIVVVSSVLARLGVPKYSAYCASKAGLLGLTRSWAAELAPERILVNAICPGWVNTNMSKQGLEDMAEGSGQAFETVLASEMDKIPLGKMSEPFEIAGLVQFLLGGVQFSITGQTLDINGGALMV